MMFHHVGLHPPKKKTKQAWKKRRIAFASHWPNKSCAEAVCEPVTHFSGNYFIMKTRKINEVLVVSGLPHAGSTGEWILWICCVRNK